MLSACFSRNDMVDLAGIPWTESLYSTFQQDTDFGVMDYIFVLCDMVLFMFTNVNFESLIALRLFALAQVKIVLAHR